MQRSSSLPLVLLCLAAATVPAQAQYRPYTPPTPPPAAVPHTPPVVTTPPGVFEHTTPLPPFDVVVPGRTEKDPDIVIPMPPGPPPPDAGFDLADQILEELSRCLADGMTQIVDCLRENHSSVSIRRLEACLRSESIPQEADGVRACLAAGYW